MTNDLKILKEIRSLIRGLSYSKIYTEILREEVDTMISLEEGKKRKSKPVKTEVWTR